MADTVRSAPDAEQLILTVGHSTHPLPEFLDLLHGAEVAAIADVRRLPGSLRYPWFDQPALAESLAETGNEYGYFPALTGRRPAQRDVPDAVNGAWRNRSFHNYADYALSEEFSVGLEELLELVSRTPDRVAVMCAEAVWWRCHRRIIADHLLARGVLVAHLMPDGRIVPASLTPGAVPRGGAVEYPAVDIDGAPPAGSAVRN